VGTFHAYRQWLRQFDADQEPIHLMLDCYSVHRSAATHGVGIILAFHPTWVGQMSFNPLDRYIFGTPKSTMSTSLPAFSLHGNRRRADPHRDALQFLKEAWDRPEAKVIEAG
jgi:hypothetical protein